MGIGETRTGEYEGEDIRNGTEGAGLTDSKGGRSRVPVGPKHTDRGVRADGSTDEGFTQTRTPASSRKGRVCVRCPEAPVCTTRQIKGERRGSLSTRPASEKVSGLRALAD